MACRQWSWPVDLPLPLLGIFRARILTMSDTSGRDVPWADEIQFENFSESIGIAPYSEVLLLPPLCPPLATCQVMSSDMQTS